MLKRQFGRSKLSHLQAFHTPKAATKTYAEHVQELVSMYLGYLGTSAGQCDPLTRASAEQRVLEYLITSAPPSARDSLVALIEAKETTYMEAARHLDTWIQAHPQQQAAYTRKSARPLGTCKIHGPGHPDAKCRVQLSNPNTASTVTRPSPTCFRCNQVGHRAPDCPQPRNQGNA